LSSSYRILRPKIFDEVISQEFITTSIKNQLKFGKTSHAYLFSGPRGVGKTSVARIFAKALNCKNLKDGNPCRECENCKLIESGRTMDIIEIDGASQRKIEEARELIETVKFPPSVLSKKVYIIDEVHQLTKESISALLKTLEEPPEYAVFILATTETQKMLPTIVSRCQHFSFRPIPKQKMLEVLQNAVSLTGVSASSDALELIALKSEGCARDALSIFDQVAGFSEDKKISIEIARDILGVVPTKEIFEILEKILEKNQKVATELFHNLYFKGVASEIIFENLISITRNFLIYISTDGEAIFDTTNEEILEFKNFLSQKKPNSRQLVFVLEELIQAKRYFSIVENPMIPVEIAIFKSTNFENFGSIKESFFELKKEEVLKKEVFTHQNFQSETREKEKIEEIKKAEENEKIKEEEKIEIQKIVKTEEVQAESLPKSDFNSKIQNSQNPDSEKITKLIERALKEKMMLGRMLKNAKIFEREKDVLIEPNGAGEGIIKMSENFEYLKKLVLEIFEKPIFLSTEEEISGDELKGVLKSIFSESFEE